MKVTVVKKIDMIAMLDRGMAAVFAVLVIVILVGFAIVFTHNA